MFFFCFSKMKIYQHSHILEFNRYVKALNPHILGKISKDLNIICVHLRPNIYVYEMCKMFNSCLCWLSGVLILSLFN